MAEPKTGSLHNSDLAVGPLHTCVTESLDKGQVLVRVMTAGWLCAALVGHIPFLSSLPWCELVIRNGLVCLAIAK